MRLLLKNGATADFANLKGTTALMRSSQEGHVEISRLLIESEADVNRKNHEGMNALMLASQRGHADTVLLLVKAGAVMDEQTSQGSTALMLACKRGHEKCVEVLVTMGAEIYCRDSRNRTARDTATRRNHTNLLYWLDTQVQVHRMQEYRRRQRSYLLMEMRNAYTQNRLRLHPSEVQLVNVLESFHLVNDDDAGNNTSRARISSAAAAALGRSHAGVMDLLTDRRAAWTSHAFVKPKGQHDTSLPPYCFIDANSFLESVVVSRGSSESSPSSLRKKYPYYHDWQWSKILFR